MAAFNRPICCVRFLDSSNLYARVAAAGGDSIAIHDGIVTINSKQCDTAYIRSAIIEGHAAREYSEALPNGHRHRIFVMNAPPEYVKRSVEGLRVPRDCYYLLGDNRDDAQDSRWRGSIPISHIKGQVLYAYWG